ncbi:uncharacterized protein DC041_0001115 [Schistosoma bovis]|uniref:Uncharacterized protein n=1 Tax=Schistosoma bovis TaxID=6184 RepID=A0A430Q403_SCHBO|nr:uncharacterized protein DC041_0001115 [Schistosoma bovis]
MTTSNESRKCDFSPIFIPRPPPPDLLFPHLWGIEKNCNHSLSSLCSSVSSSLSSSSSSSSSTSSSPSMSQSSSISTSVYTTNCSTSYTHSNQHNPITTIDNLFNKKRLSAFNPLPMNLSTNMNIFNKREFPFNNNQEFSSNPLTSSCNPLWLDYYYYYHHHHHRRRDHHDLHDPQNHYHSQSNYHYELNRPTKVFLTNDNYNQLTMINNNNNEEEENNNSLYNHQSKLKFMKHSNEENISATTTTTTTTTTSVTTTTTTMTTTTTTATSISTIPINDTTSNIFMNLNDKFNVKTCKSTKIISQFNKYDPSLKYHKSIKKRNKQSIIDNHNHNNNLYNTNDS